MMSIDVDPHISKLKAVGPASGLLKNALSSFRTPRKRRSGIQKMRRKSGRLDSGPAPSVRPGMTARDFLNIRLEHNPEKRNPVFG